MGRAYKPQRSSGLPKTTAHIISNTKCIDLNLYPDGIKVQKLKSCSRQILPHMRKLIAEFVPIRCFQAVL